MSVLGGGYGAGAAMPMGGMPMGGMPTTTHVHGICALKFENGY
jgi:hypothetical protein